MEVVVGGGGVAWVVGVTLGGDGGEGSGAGEVVEGGVSVAVGVSSVEQAPTIRTQVTAEINTKGASLRPLSAKRRRQLGPPGISRLFTSLNLRYRQESTNSPTSGYRRLVEF